MATHSPPRAPAAPAMCRYWFILLPFVFPATRPTSEAGKKALNSVRDVHNIFLCTCSLYAACGVRRADGRPCPCRLCARVPHLHLPPCASLLFLLSHISSFLSLSLFILPFSFPSLPPSLLSRAAAAAACCCCRVRAHPSATAALQVPVLGVYAAHACPSAQVRLNIHLRWIVCRDKHNRPHQLTIESSTACAHRHTRAHGLPCTPRAAGVYSGIACFGTLYYLYVYPLIMTPRPTKSFASAHLGQWSAPRSSYCSSIVRPPPHHPYGQCRRHDSHSLLPLCAGTRTTSSTTMYAKTQRKKNAQNIRTSDLPYRYR